MGVVGGVGALENVRIFMDVIFVLSPNKIGSTKWTYHKVRSFSTYYFIFLKI